MRWEQDVMVSAYIPRTLPAIQAALNTTRQRLVILPGAPPQLLDTARSISDIQTTLSRKALAL